MFSTDYPLLIYLKSCFSSTTNQSLVLKPKGQSYIAIWSLTPPSLVIMLGNPTQWASGEFLEAIAIVTSRDFTIEKWLQSTQANTTKRNRPLIQLPLSQLPKCSWPLQPPRTQGKWERAVCSERDNILNWQCFKHLADANFTKMYHHVNKLVGSLPSLGKDLCKCRSFKLKLY